MREDDRSYFTRRERDEVRRAAVARNVEVAALHFELARHYRQRLETLQRDNRLLPSHDQVPIVRRRAIQGGVEHR